MCELVLLISTQRYVISNLDLSPKRVLCSHSKISEEWDKGMDLLFYDDSVSVPHLVLYSVASFIMMSSVQHIHGSKITISPLVKLQYY